MRAMALSQILVVMLIGTVAAEPACAADGTCAADSDAGALLQVHQNKSASSQIPTCSKFAKGACTNSERWGACENCAISPCAPSMVGEDGCDLLACRQCVVCVHNCKSPPSEENCNMGNVGGFLKFCRENWDDCTSCVSPYHGV